MPFPTDLVPPIATWASLRQAIQWIAYDWLPLPKEYESARENPTSLPYSNDPRDEEYALVRKAQAALFQVLYDGRLEAQGLLGDVRFGGKQEFREYSLLRADKKWWWRSNQYAEEYSDIPQKFWRYETVDWDRSHAWRYDIDWDNEIPLEMPEEGIDYIYILIKTDDLLAVFPPEIDPDADASEQQMDVGQDESAKRSPPGEDETGRGGRYAAPTGGSPKKRRRGRAKGSGQMTIPR